MYDDRDNIDFAKEPVGRLFLQMLIPTILGMVSMVVLNITDGAFVGHGVGGEALAAVNIAAPIFNLGAGLGIMFGIGCSVVASIHLSRGKVKAANINVTQAMIACMLITLVMSVVILLNLNATCRLFGASKALVPLAASYLWWIALFQPLNMLGMLGSFMVRLDGNPRFAMGCTVFASLMNIFLDWLLIFPLHMGLPGAAIATSVSFSLSALILLWYILKRSKTIRFYRLRLTLKSLMFSLRNISYQIRMGFSGLLGEMAISGVIIVGNYVFIAYLGEDGVAAYSVACYCLPISFMMANAIVQSSQPIISFAYGTDNTIRMRLARQLALGSGIGAGLLGTTLLFFFAPTITSVFISRSEEAYQLCLDGLPYFSLSYLFISINLVLIGYLQSIEQASRAIIYTLLRGFVIIIPCFILLPQILSVRGIWLSMPLSEFLTMLVILLTARYKSNSKSIT